MQTLICRLLLLLAMATHLHAQEIRTYMDLQIHPTMHVPYGFFSDGLTYFDPQKPPKEHWKHQFRNVNYANYLRQNAGARVIVNGALTTETIKNYRKARRVILEQIDYVNRFAQENSEDFVVAKSPQEVRDYVLHTSKTVIIHSIEGGRKLVESQADADFWASQGVAFITLIHLVDYYNGAAAIKPGLFPALLNFKGLWKPQRRRGLTERGKQAILWLANAGVMTDLTHMSDQTRKDALTLMEAHHIPPFVSHDLFKPVHNQPRGIAPEDVQRIYQNGGFMSLPISGWSCLPHHPDPQYRALLDSLQQADCYCRGSIDSYQFSYLAFQRFVQDSIAPRLFGQPFPQLSEAQKVDLSIGFQSDFNGWISHSRPRYGKQGCYDTIPNTTLEPITTLGLQHEGLLESQWRYLEQQGVDLEPIRRSAEKFLQLWQHFLDKRGSFSIPSPK